MKSKCAIGLIPKLVLLCLATPSLLPPLSDGLLRMASAEEACNYTTSVQHAVTLTATTNTDQTSFKALVQVGSIEFAFPWELSFGNGPVDAVYTWDLTAETLAAPVRRAITGFSGPSGFVSHAVAVGSTIYANVAGVYYTSGSESAKNNHLYSIDSTTLTATAIAGKDNAMAGTSGCHAGPWPNPLTDAALSQTGGLAVAENRSQIFILTACGQGYTRPYTIRTIDLTEGNGYYMAWLAGRPTATTNDMVSSPLDGTFETGEIAFGGGLARIGNRLYFLDSNSGSKQRLRVADIDTQLITTLTTTSGNSGTTMPLSQLQLKGTSAYAISDTDNLHWNKVTDEISTSISASPSGHLVLQDKHNLYLIDTTASSDPTAVLAVHDSTTSKGMTGSLVATQGTMLTDAGSWPIWYATQPADKQQTLSKVLVSPSAGCADVRPFRRYRLFRAAEKVAQDQADVACGTRGGWLANFATAADFNQLKDDLFAVQTSFEDNTLMTGGSDENDEGVFVWKYGRPSTRGSKISSGSNNNCAQAFCNWRSGEPNDSGVGEDALAVRSSDWLWNDIKDGVEDQSPATRSFICEFSETEVRTVRVQRYYGVEHSENVVTSQAEASARCALRGGFLGTFRNESDWTQFVDDMAYQGNGMPANNMMTGGSDVDSEGNYVWKYGPAYNRGLPISSGNAPTTTCTAAPDLTCRWYPGEPDNRENNEHVMALRSDFTWKDMPFNKKKYLCEFPNGFVVPNFAEAHELVTGATAPAAAPASSPNDSPSEQQAGAGEFSSFTVVAVVLCCCAVVVVGVVFKRVQAAPAPASATDASANAQSTTTGDETIHDTLPAPAVVTSTVSGTFVAATKDENGSAVCTAAPTPDEGHQLSDQQSLRGSGDADQELQEYV